MSKMLNLGKKIWRFQVIALLFCSEVGADIGNRRGGVFPQHCATASIVASLLLLEIDDAEVGNFREIAPYFVARFPNSSLLNIKNCIDCFGCFSQGYHVSSVSGLSKLLENKDCVYVLNFLNTQSGEGHFVVCHKKLNGKIILVDYPLVVEADSVIDAIKKSTKLEGYEFSGGVLEVRKNHANEGLSSLSSSGKNKLKSLLLPEDKPENLFSIHDSTNFENANLYCEIQNSGEEVLQGYLSIINNASSEISIKNIESSCSCFQGAEFPQQVIKKHSIAKIKLKYRSDLLSLIKRNNLIMELSLSGKRLLIPIESVLKPKLKPIIRREFDDSNGVIVTVVPSVFDESGEIVLDGKDEELDVTRISNHAFHVKSRSGSLRDKKFRIKINEIRYDVNVFG